MLAGPPFMQNLPPSGQQQIGPNHPGLPNAANPAMMLGNPPNPMSSQQRYMQQIQHAELRQSRQMPLRQVQGGQPLLGPSGAVVPGGAGAPHMGGMARNPSMGFNTNMIPQPQVGLNVRRVSSQPQLNQGSGQLGGMSPNAVNSTLGLGMNPQGNMSNMHPGFRMQQPQQPLQGQIPPEMPMSMNRSGGNSGIVPSRTASAQAQVMNSLSQPASLAHTMGPHQNQFQNPITSQHQPPQKVSSPRPGSHHSQNTPSMSMATPGPSRTPVNSRPHMPPGDGPLFMDFPNSQFPQGRIPSGQFPFVPSSTPPIPIAEMPQSMSGTPGGTPNRTSFHITPAQQFEQMNPPLDNFQAHFAMAPPQHAPPRPSSQHSLHPPLSQQPQLPQSHPSPSQSDLHMNSLPQRPQSQPQTLPRPPSQQAHTPRTQLPPGPPQPSGARIPLPSHGGQGPQMQNPGAGSHMAIAPRPAQVPAPSGPSTAAPSTQAPGDSSPPGSASIPRPVPNPYGTILFLGR